MIGAEDVGDALVQAPPDPFAVGGVPDRRVHLHQSPEPGIGFRAVEGEMMRRHLHRRDVLVVGEIGHLLGGRDVQDVDTRARLMGDAHEPLGRLQRGFGRTPDRVRGRIARHPQPLALPQHRLVLGMEGGAPARALQDLGHAGIVLDEQRPGGGAHEHLDPGRPRQPFERGDLMRVLVCSADPEGEVAMHAVMPARDLVTERRRAGRQRVGVGHLEHRRHPAHDGGARARFEVFLVVEPRLAEMDLGVDHPGQQVQAGAVAALGGRGRRQVADGGDAPSPHPEIGAVLTVLVHDRAARQDEIEGLVHRCRSGLALRRGMRRLMSASRGAQRRARIALEPPCRSPCCRTAPS